MSAPGYAGNQRIVDINSDAGAFISILAQSPVRRLKIQESPLTAAGAANTLQGSLEYQLPNDDTANGFTETFEAIGSTGDQWPVKIELGNPVGQIGPWGEVLGNGPGPLQGIVGGSVATTLIKIRSGTATATSIMVTECN